MTETFELRFDSILHAPQARIWTWITSAEGIAAEMRPWLRMTAPAGFRLQPERVRPGEPLFRSRLLLLGIVPVDTAEMTLVAIDPGRGFVERSPMRSMRHWEHHRRIEPLPGGQAVRLHDRLVFAPRWCPRLVRQGVRGLFLHRHRVLGRHFAPAGGARAR